jgi:transcriptional regulator with XRE-family HTH domain
MAKGYHWREYDWEHFEPGELKRLRQARGLSQEQAARTIGFSANTWARWERGERIPYPAHYRLIRSAFVYDDQEDLEAHSGQG